MEAKKNFKNRIWKSGRFDVAADNVLLKKITDDLGENAGPMKPWDGWSYNYEKVQTMQRAIIPWLGWGRVRIEENQKSPPGNLIASPTYIEDMIEYIKVLDHLGIGDRLDYMCSMPDALAADLHSMIDTLLMTAFYERSPDSPPKTRILEVGGGYGRLFETMRYLTDWDMEYILVDAVPTSLVFAYQYLKTHYPELKIGLSYAGDRYAPGQWDVYVMPSWHIDQLKDSTFDIAINISSFQEMNQYHVDAYLKLFDDQLRPGGLVYLCNSRDYRFDGEYNYPGTWRSLYMDRPARAWTRLHPTEIFEKTDHDARGSHRAHLAAHMAALRLAEIYNQKIIEKRANLRAVIPLTPLKCILRCPGPDDPKIKRLSDQRDRK
ncbi:MAG: putative sugar O-methyltransferase [Alphaproteobacteria bacterium]|nr:putative sugar O-methyltransferase [Alphaproteobacteria bacterium]